MTMPRSVQRVADMVREWLPTLRYHLTVEEQQLATLIRGNEALVGSLESFVLARINGRANLPESSDPLECRVRAAKDYELRWLMNRIRFVQKSPINPQVGDNGEQPS